MQSVQTIVLEPLIRPGITPIFIVSPSMKVANTLAVLLSENIQPENNLHGLKTNISEDDNYFINSELQKFYKRFAQKRPKIDEAQDIIQLLVEEGMDNRKLWGIQCEYNFFFDLKLYDLFDTAFYIFLYSDQPAMEITTKKYEHELLSFSSIHSNNYVFLNEQQVSYLPDILLNYFQNQPVYNTNKIFKHTLKRNCLRQASFNKEIARKNTLLESGFWFNGHEFSVIFICLEHYTPQQLNDKLELLCGGLSVSPLITFLVQKTEVISDINELTDKFLLTNFEIRTLTTTDHLPYVLNEIISGSYAEFIIIDDLLLSYPLSQLIYPFLKDQSPAFSSATFSSDTDNTDNKVYLTDTLTTCVIQHNILFKKELWAAVKGFDTTLSSATVLWDFTIRSIISSSNHGKITNAFVGNATSPLENTSINAIPQDAYKKITSKHRLLLEQSVDDILLLLSEKQYLPQNTIKKLNYKLGTLQSLLSHSRDELRALHELSANLQQRIHSLENRWYYRLGKRINKFKKIFFKKKTPGVGTLKRLLEFLKFATSKTGFRIVRKVIKGLFKKMYLIAEDRPVKIIYLDIANANSSITTYHDWLQKKLDTKKIKQEYDSAIDTFAYKPRISIVMPVYNPPVKLLKEAIESVINQLYTNWELCIADDCSPNTQIKKLLHAYEVKYPQIKICFRKENGHISASSNSALELATGEFILLMDHDDLLSKNCLFEVVQHINEHPAQEIIYSDEDKVDENGMHTMAHFKPDWAPHSLLSRNYFGHVVVIKKNIIDAIGGFRLGYEGSQDYDLLLRATEITHHIGHIPKVLYHWRIHSKSAAQSEDVKPYAYIAAKKALEDTLIRRNLSGQVHYLSGLRGYRIRYEVKQTGKVSIIIPSKDQVKLLKNAVDSIIKLTEYSNYEIIILNNNSTSNDFFAFIKQYTKEYNLNFRCIDANFPFNFSKLMNLGVRESSGEYILFLNNDVEIIHNDWLTQMVSYAQQPEIGAVGVKLLYPDDTIQHAGVIVGLGGVAGHTFVNFHKDEAGYFNYIQSVNNFSAVTAACMLCRREVYEEVGGMDEVFEVEYNDIDLCLKFTSAGYYNVYLPDVMLYHYESATRGHPHQSKESWERHVREIALFKEKWQHIIDRDPYYNLNLNLGTHDFSLNFSA